MSSFSEVGFAAWDAPMDGIGDGHAEHPMARLVPGITGAQGNAAMADGPVLVLAGAGSGKTRVLTSWAVRRIRLGARDAEGTMARTPPHRILAVTFTNKAAKEMRNRIRTMLEGGPAPDWIGTFHGHGARQLRTEPEIAGLRAGFDILDADDSKAIIKRTMQALHGLGDEEMSDTTAASLKAITNRISRMKDNLIAAEDAQAQIEATIERANQLRHPIDVDGLRLAARVYVEYQRRLQEANSADFGDLILYPTRAMMSSDGYRRRWADKFDAVAVDEYQDVNKAQYMWLKLFALDHKQILVVGDDDQSIHGWRGADVGYIRSFQRDFKDAQVFKLEENFRSTGHILDAANAIIEKDEARLGKSLYTRKGKGHQIEVVMFRDADGEAVGLAAELQRRHVAENVEWHDFAILVRASFLTRTLEEGLMRLRIPYVLVGDVGFYQRREIKDALALLRLLTSLDDKQSDEAFRRMCNTPSRGVGEKKLNMLEEAAAQKGASLFSQAEHPPFDGKAAKSLMIFADAIRSVAESRSLTLADKLSLLLDKTGYRDMLRGSEAESAEERFENLQELMILAGEFNSAWELLDHAALASAAPNEEGGGRVQIMTMHKAKGLEFRTVILPAWEEGIFPSTYGDVAEERRLAYVALTRGMERVVISHTEFRRGPMMQSSFVRELPKETCIRGWHNAAAQHARGRAAPVVHQLEDFDYDDLLKL